VCPSPFIYIRNKRWSSGCCYLFRFERFPISKFRRFTIRYELFNCFDFCSVFVIRCIQNFGCRAGPFTLGRKRDFEELKICLSFSLKSTPSVLSMKRNILYRNLYCWSLLIIEALRNKVAHLKASTLFRKVHQIFEMNLFFKQFIADQVLFSSEQTPRLQRASRRKMQYA
jgi:hypothetical protein